MTLPEPLSASLAKIPFKKALVCLRQVDNDQPVEYVGKVPVDAEIEDLATDIQVLPQ
jgi:hypothetical protein